MKVVINNCFGGFSLSPLACQEWAKRKGKPCYFFSSDLRSDDNVFTPLTLSEAEKDFFVNAFSVKNPGEILARKKPWSEMSMEERKDENRKWKQIEISERATDRSDPDLVAVVKKLGHRANGRYAQLKIVTVPDGIKWHIEEYDGLEHIAEDHRTFR